MHSRLQRELPQRHEGAENEGLVAASSCLDALGAGVELDISGINLIFTRVRFLARYLIGQNVTAVSGGISATWS